MLGKALVPVFREKYEVRATDLPEHDIRDKPAIIDDICSFHPNFVLHLASMTDVDGCEKNPQQAYLSNTAGTRNVAIACSRCDATMAYISTGMIYNGRKKGPYIEYDKPDPVNVYASTKYQGELEIGKLLKHFFIFNTCWVFGGGRQDSKFVARILELAVKNNKLRVVNDKIGSPTYTVDMAKAIFGFIESGKFGRYHCVNEGSVTRFGLAKEILRIAGITDCLLTPVSSDEFPLPAPRPDMEAMSNYGFRLLGLGPMRKWQDALEEYIKTVLL